MKDEEPWSLESVLTAPTDCMVLSLGVSAELGEVWEEESAAGLELWTSSEDWDAVGLEIHVVKHNIQRYNKCTVLQEYMSHAFEQ